MPISCRTRNVIVCSSRTRAPARELMDNGNKPTDGGHLMLDWTRANDLLAECPAAANSFVDFSDPGISSTGRLRYCILDYEDHDAEDAQKIPQIELRIDSREERSRVKCRDASTKLATRPHRFVRFRASLRKRNSLSSPESVRRIAPILPVGLAGSEYDHRQSNLRSL